MSQSLLSRNPYRNMYVFRRPDTSSRTHFVSRKFAFGPSTLIIGLILIAIFMSFLHLLHFNQVATKGYDLRRLETDRQHLLEQFQAKNMHVTEIKSLNVISQSHKAQSMVRQGELNFVRGDTALAFGKIR